MISVCMKGSHGAALAVHMLVLLLLLLLPPLGAGSLPTARPFTTKWVPISVMVVVTTAFGIAVGRAVGAAAGH
jgi:hypothetical protein